MMARHSLSWYAAGSAGILFGIFTGWPGVVFVGALVAHLKKRRYFQNRVVAHVR